MATGNALAEFLPGHVELPAASAAAWGTRNAQPHLAFDAATNESAVFSGIMPAHYGAGGINVNLLWRATSATSGNVRWQVEIERQNDEGLDTDADSFATAVEATAAAPATAGMLQYTTVALSNSEIDGLLVNERFRIRVTREANDATNDTMTGDAELVSVYIREQ
jgi:hypothetical protein